VRGAGPTGGGTGRVIGGFLPRLSFGQSSEKTRTAACMNCMQVSIGPGVRIDRSCPSARRAAGGCWLGVLLLLGLLVLGRWGAQPGGVRPGGVSTLPPLSTVVLRHTPVAGAFKMDMMAIEDAGGDDDDAPTETQKARRRPTAACDGPCDGSCGMRKGATLNCPVFRESE
jgi:hypothetical protein